MKKNIKSLETNNKLNVNMGAIEYAEAQLIVAHSKLGLAYEPDQILSALKVLVKCLYLDDKNQQKDYDSLKNRFLRWRNETFAPQEGESLFENIEKEPKDVTKLTEEILENLMMFYENTPRIYYVWLLRDWKIFDSYITEKARIWMADGCNYREDIPAKWYETY